MVYCVLCSVHNAGNIVYCVCCIVHRVLCIIIGHVQLVPQLAHKCQAQAQGDGVSPDGDSVFLARRERERVIVAEVDVAFAHQRLQQRAHDAHSAALYKKPA